MIHVFNPGTEPVEDASEEQAIANATAFFDTLKDGLTKQFGGRKVLADEMRLLRVPQIDGDGRYGFLIYRRTMCHEILMPGCPLEQVSAGRPFYSPRLYVDGSSWLWGYGLSILTEVERWVSDESLAYYRRDGNYDPATGRFSHRFD